MISAFAYLTVHTMRNRFVSMARRLRQPRYLVGFLFVVGYFGFLLFGTATGFGRGADAKPSGLQGDFMRVAAPALLALALAANWIGSAAVEALAFTPAEVAMLFPAPVTRRSLIMLKIARAQLPIVFNIIIIMLLFGVGSSAMPLWLNALGLYVLFATIHLHRLGAALVRVSTLKHGTAGLKRNWLSYVIAVVILAAMFLIFISAKQGADPGEGVTAILDRITAALATPWVHAVLIPFALITAPALARTTAEWSVAFAGALAMLALHLWWVLRSHTAFEEAAAEQSEKFRAMLESFRKRGHMNIEKKPPARRLTLPLRPTGHPAIAIVWKNSLTFLRTFSPLTWFLLALAPALVAVMMRDKGANAFAAAGMIAAMLAVMLLFVGGSIARNDLRGDLLNLSALKTMPLRGSTIVFAEVCSSALPLAAIQCMLLWIAVAGWQMGKKALPPDAAIALAVVLPLGVAGLNVLASTVRNGAAVLFPAWTELGVDGGSGGLETMGQSMLGLLAMLLGFLVLMIVPALTTTVIVAWIHPPPAVALVSSIVLGSAATVGESYLVMLWIGRVLERTEPSAALTVS